MRLSVPVLVIVPPFKPVPAITEVTVPCGCAVHVTRPVELVVRALAVLQFMAVPVIASSLVVALVEVALTVIILSNQLGSASVEEAKRPPLKNTLELVADMAVLKVVCRGKASYDERKPAVEAHAEAAEDTVPSAATCKHFVPVLPALETIKLVVEAVAAVRYVEEALVKVMRLRAVVKNRVLEVAKRKSEAEP